MPLYNPASGGSDATLTFTDITTNNSSTTKHGFLKKLDNSATNFMNGQGDWAAPGVSAAGLNNGTSNPGSPSDGDLFHRTDLGLIIRYYSSGTRWMCVCPHIQNIAHQDQLTPASATHSSRAAYPVALTTDILVQSVAWGVFVNTTNDGTKYWTMAMPNGVTLSTAASSPGVATKLSDTTALVVPLSTWAADCAVTKVSTPGTIYYTAAFTYRYIVT